MDWHGFSIVGTTKKCCARLFGCPHRTPPTIAVQFQQLILTWLLRVELHRRAFLGSSAGESLEKISIALKAIEPDADSITHQLAYSKDCKTERFRVVQLGKPEEGIFYLHLHNFPKEFKGKTTEVASFYQEQGPFNAVMSNLPQAGKSSCFRFKR